MKQDNVFVGRKSLIGLGGVSKDKEGKEVTGVRSRKVL